MIRRELVKTFISGPPHPKSLLASLGILFFCALFSQLYWQDNSFSEMLPATRQLVYDKHEAWRLFTAMFIHSDLQHLLSNSYMLGILSFFVFGYFGSLAFPVLALAGATLTNGISIYTYEPDVSLVGASGLVYFLAGFWLAMFIGIERQRTLAKRILRATGVGFAILFPTSFEPQISYRTHAIGFGVGIVFAIFYFSLHRKKIRRAEVYKEVLDEEDGSPV